MKTLKVLAACGSGIATSSYAEAAVKDIAKNAGVKIDVSKSTIQESETKSYAFDVVLFTSINWSNFISQDNLNCPAMSVAPLINCNFIRIFFYINTINCLTALSHCIYYNIIFINVNCKRKR